MKPCANDNAYTVRLGLPVIFRRGLIKSCMNSTHNIHALRRLPGSGKIHHTSKYEYRWDMVTVVVSVNTGALGGKCDKFVTGETFI